MLPRQEPDILSKSGNKLSLYFYVGAKTDITDHLRPIMRKKRDGIIMHAGTNDSTNDINTMEYVRNVTNVIDDMNGASDVQGGFSAGIIERTYLDLSKKVTYENEILKGYCNSKGFLFKNYCIVDENSLNKSLLDIS